MHYLFFRRKRSDRNLEALTLLISALLLVGVYSTVQDQDIRQVIPAGGKRVDVPKEVMNEIYGKIRTPFKYGIILKGDSGKKIDCPNVFRHSGKPWVIYYKGIVYHFYCAVGNEGRVIALATSKDLRTKVDQSTKKL